MLVGIFSVSNILKLNYSYFQMTVWILLHTINTEILKILSWIDGKYHNPNVSSII